MASLAEFFKPERHRRDVLAGGVVAPEAVRCVQCGICSFNCPIGIDVRRQVWLDRQIEDPHCLTCGECVRRCPRGVLRFTKADLVREAKP